MHGSWNKINCMIFVFNQFNRLGDSNQLNGLSGENFIDMSDIHTPKGMGLF